MEVPLKPEQIITPGLPSRHHAALPGTGKDGHGPKWSFSAKKKLKGGGATGNSTHVGSKKEKHMTC